jgi:precorrin-8X/cobalt-precorrin-8 methylmutase
MGTGIIITGTTTATGRVTTGTATAPQTATRIATPPSDWLRDPAAIMRRSLELIAAEADLGRLPESLRPLAARLVHTCAMPDIVADLAWRGDPVAAGRRALATGAAVLVDARMVAAGITRLPAECEIVCTLGDPAGPGLARAGRTTRSAAAVDLWIDRLRGSVVAIGNAPTALFRLLELLAEGAPRPAVILAFPVGFVGATESKEALIATPGDVPFVTLRGRRGGSAMAAAAVNTLAVAPGPA